MLVDNIYGFGRPAAAGNCVIDELSLTECKPDQDTVAFVQKLHDRDSVLAGTLGKVMLDCDMETPFDVKVLVAVEAILQANKTLEYLKLSVPPELNKSASPCMNQFDGKTIPVVKTSLPLSCRLMFLSVELAKQQGLNEASKEEDQQAKRQRLDRCDLDDFKSLDRDVVALIFHFAAERKTRAVELKVLRDEDESNFSDDDFGNFDK